MCTNKLPPAPHLCTLIISFTFSHIIIIPLSSPFIYVCTTAEVSSHRDTHTHTHTHTYTNIIFSMRRPTQFSGSEEDANHIPSIYSPLSFSLSFPLRISLVYSRRALTSMTSQ
ncbi:hypothetical protein, unlikely [Trypanosoma brucei gambiense DAL972]|uniref:Uncharacterized protein n=1 Tax=Trypanosoma brucei gambiense (strain MHOM/CI/86/DAL972) TaxID=679716 RepID=C9ZKG0_TRYB9|nr:hypothetical protein, unlikely [Trypanosoma brucei gambiense DAL972]CBH09926.1 hypothetical protein, unlikely [Trypanosoma brucei gambiense DAL972]|eukprot:XP_011772217.1 hypothetical protein, unlikely [Trypanosoma brucei gambiense DAL972]